MKRHWGTDELVERWTLLPRETELLTQIPKLGNRPRPYSRSEVIHRAGDESLFLSFRA